MLLKLTHPLPPVVDLTSSPLHELEQRLGRADVATGGEELDVASGLLGSRRVAA
jgi:hypothetical protein